MHVCISLGVFLCVWGIFLCLKPFRTDFVVLVRFHLFLNDSACSHLSELIHESQRVILHSCCRAGCLSMKLKRGVLPTCGQQRGTVEYQMASLCMGFEAGPSSAEDMALWDESLAVTLCSGSAGAERAHRSRHDRRQSLLMLICDAAAAAVAVVVISVFTPCRPSRLCEIFKHGLMLSTDYSGTGGPETVFKAMKASLNQMCCDRLVIVFPVAELIHESCLVSAHRPIVAAGRRGRRQAALLRRGLALPAPWGTWRACDVDKTARSILRQQGAQHVFQDILQRLPLKAVEKVRLIMMKCSSRGNDAGEGVELVRQYLRKRLSICFSTSTADSHCELHPGKRRPAVAVRCP